MDPRRRGSKEVKMSEPIENRNLIDIQTLISPRNMKAAVPSSAAADDTVVEARRAIRDVIHGRDTQRLVVIVGPCSIHDPEAALEYAQRLSGIAKHTADAMVLVMRAYFEKPRTTVGWKGLINDPRLDGSCDVATGLEIARRLLVEINELGIPCGSEVLDPFTPQFIADLLCWGGIGARTIESQTHRQLASGLSMPIGFKNGTDGVIDGAVNAMVTASHSHTFLGITADGESALVQTRGNPDRHIVLRGGVKGPNFSPEFVAEAARLVAQQGLVRPVMVDCSHANSGKDHSRQGFVCREVLDQIRVGNPAIMGLLIESNLEPGRQSWQPGTPLRRGISITDACIGWEETEKLLHEIAETVRFGQPPHRAISVLS
jgi:3-deoxy-7-phosphoheptulonate synthase